MGVTIEGHKRPSPMSSEEEVALAVGNIARNIKANVENTESTTVDQYVEFERPPEEVGIISNPTCRVPFGISLSKAVLHLTSYLVRAKFNKMRITLSLIENVALGVSNLRIKNGKI